MKNNNSQNTLDDMGIFKNESNSNDLFAKMKSDLPQQNNQLFSSQTSEIERIEKEKKEKEMIEAYIKKQNSLSNNYLLGFIAAFIGGLIGAIPWALLVSQGIFAAYCGFLIAFVSSKAYDLVKVKPNTKKIWCIVISIIISVFAGQIVGDVIAISTYAEIATLFNSTSDALSYYFEHFDTMLEANAPNLFIGYIFAALGALRVFKEIKKENEFLKQMKEKYPEVDYE